MSRVFAATLLLSSALVFMVQPMAGRMLLPILGGTAVVWNVALVFFQAMLLGGYLYAHISSRYLSVRLHVAVHLVLMMVAAVFLPVGFDASGLEPAAPVPWLLGALTLGVGLPFLLVSSTAPLLQRWYARTDASDADDPYFLYSASNIGSIGGLFLYPLVLEAFLPVSTQSWVWTGGYVALVAMVLATGLVTRRHARKPGVEASEAPPTPLTWRRRAGWVALAFVPSSLLLSTTAKITDDLAATPILWMIPLGAYLLTFVMAFARKRLIPQNAAVWLGIAALVMVVIQLSTRSVAPIMVIVAIHMAGLFFASLAFHGALVDDRPDARQLTDFYIWMSVGGVLGGAFNALVAPAVFNVMIEHAGVVAVALVWLSWKTERPGRRGTAAIMALAVVFSALAAILVYSDVESASAQPALLVVALPTLLLAYSPRIAAIIAAVAGMFFSTRLVDSDALRLARSPYGAYAVVETEKETGTLHYLYHGNTNHGAQLRASELRALPISYYHPATPIGQVITTRFASGRRDHIAVIGLGAGALASYARQGTTATFFEIDPTVAELASDPENFTYLSDCGDACQVVLGDGRLALARSDAAYDLIVLDAYNSDSIPVHLVTREAFDVYLDHLSDDGLLIFHTTNRHIDVSQIVVNVASSKGLSWREQKYWVRKPEHLAIGVDSSDVVIVARDTVMLPNDDPRWVETKPDERPVWTDDFASIFPYY